MRRIMSNKYTNQKIFLTGNTMEEVRVPLDKKAYIIVFIIEALLAVVGLWMILNPEQFASASQPNSNIFYIGWSLALLFGLMLIPVGLKAFSKKPGLLINDKGITDHSSATSYGLIEWQDITGVRLLGAKSPYALANAAISSMLIIETANAQKYIDRAKNKVTKMAMKANNKQQNSPFLIPMRALKVNQNELIRMIEEQIEKRNNRK